MYTAFLSSFSSGEISPKMRARMDAQLYRTGCKTLRNFIVTKQGAVTRRPGTYYVASSTSPVRLIPFASSSGTFLLEFSDNRIRFYKGGSLVLSGGSPYELTGTGYTWPAVGELQTAMVEDSLWITHRNYPPKKLSRISDTSWTLTTISFTPTGTFGTSGNYPGVIALHAGRVYLASTSNKPYAVWASRTPDVSTGNSRYTDFTMGVNPDDAITVLQEDIRGGRVQWLVSARRLLLGTERGEYAATEDVPTPTTLAFPMQSREGSPAIQAVPFLGGVLHVVYNRKGAGFLTYSTERGGFVWSDVSYIAEHLFASGVIEVDTQRSPYQIAWFTMADGTLVSLVADPQSGFSAFSSHDLGAPVESLAVLPSSGEDEVWVSVHRGSVRTIERFAPFNQSDINELHYVDCGLRLASDPPAYTFSGLSHLEGLKVSAIGDGAILPDVTVSGGSISYTRPIGILHVGLPFLSVMETNPLQSPGESFGFGKKKRITKAVLALYETLGGRVGTSIENAEPIIYRSSGNWEDPLPLFTGEKEKTVPGQISTTPSLCFTQSQPYSATVLAVSAELSVLET